MASTPRDEYVNRFLSQISYASVSFGSCCCVSIAQKRPRLANEFLLITGFLNFHRRSALLWCGFNFKGLAVGYCLCCGGKDEFWDLNGLGASSLGGAAAQGIGTVAVQTASQRVGSVATGATLAAGEQLLQLTGHFES